LHSTTLGGRVVVGNLNRDLAFEKEAVMRASSGVQLIEAAARTAKSSPVRELLLVVGYDGSAPAQRALDKAAELLEWREGWLEVVFVAHTPATAPFAPQAMAQLIQGFDEESTSLEKEVGARLIQQPRPWHFQRRDGAVSAQLLAAAQELQDRYGDFTDIAIVVGGPAHRYHHLAGSVSSSLARSDRFPLMVVP
jgi:nucleotide-binding universal stress UspA family protein